MLQAVDKELLSDVINTVRIFKSEVELVVSVQHLETILAGPGTSLVTARPIDVHVDVLAQIPRILKASVSGSTVGHKPGDLLRLIGGIVDRLTAVLHVVVIVLPPFVRSHNCGVRPVSGGPVEDLFVLENLGVEGRFQHKDHPYLLWPPVHTGHCEVILEDDQVCSLAFSSVCGDHTGGDRALFLDEDSPPRPYAPRRCSVPEKDLLEWSVGVLLVLRNGILGRKKHQLVSKPVARPLFRPEGDITSSRGRTDDAMLRPQLPVLHVPRPLLKLENGQIILSQRAKVERPAFFPKIAWRFCRVLRWADSYQNVNIKRREVDPGQGTVRLHSEVDHKEEECPTGEKREKCPSTTSSMHLLLTSPSTMSRLSCVQRSHGRQSASGCYRSLAARGL